MQPTRQENLARSPQARIAAENPSTDGIHMPESTPGEAVDFIQAASAQKMPAAPARLPESSPKRAPLTQGVSWKAEFSRLADEIKLRHSSRKALRTYPHWVRHFQTFTRSRNPQDLSTEHIKAFLTFLAVDQKVSASTQNLAFNALLFFLVAVTGMRISEVIGLDRNDVDLEQGLLTVRLTTFSKPRLIPLHPSTVDKLKACLNRGDQLYPRPTTSGLFLSSQGTTLTDCMVRWTFVELSRRIGPRKAGDSLGPLLHDLRHRFAVTTLLHWYETGVDVEERLHVLSTFLGHVHVTDTYWYLSTIPELLGLTRERLDKRWESLS